MFNKLLWRYLIFPLTLLSIGCTVIVGQNNSGECIGLSAASGVTGVSTAACTIMILCLPCFAACIAGTSAAWVGTTIGAGQACGKRRRRRSLQGFVSLDKNRDGFLSIEDVLTGGRNNPLKGMSFFPRLIDIADKDGDKRISKQEAKTISGEISQLTFKMVDLNGDGFIDKNELAEGGEMAGSKDLLYATRGALVSLNHMDKNKDSRISLDEFKAFMNQKQKTGK